MSVKKAAKTFNSINRLVNRNPKVRDSNPREEERNRV